MNKSRPKLPAGIEDLPRHYLELLAAFPLRPIRSASECDRATSIVHQLALREGALDAGQEAYLEVLETLVEQYEARNFALDVSGSSPTQVLRTLVEQSGMSVTELGKLLGSKGAASELLSGKRLEPSKGQIAKLCARFKVDAGVFLRKPAAPASAA